MEDLKEILAKNLRQARNHSCLSQEDLAALADIDRTYVSGIERGLRNPTILVLARFADALNINAASLLVKDAFSTEIENQEK